MNDFNIAALVSQFLQPGAPATGGRQLWAIDKDGIRESLMTVDAIRSADTRSLGVSRRGDRFGGGTFMTRVGSVAIVPVMGPLVARMSWQYWSYDEVIRDLRLAAADDTIDAIMLDIDSPGGMVANVEAAAREIQTSAAQKPVIAHIGGLGASAAYWLAASASEVHAAPTSLVGSVGCLIRYMDIEGIFEKLGARIVEVIAQQSPNKRLDPDSDEGRAELQAIADNGAALFLEGLAEARGVDRETLMAAYGQGLVLTAQDALSRGLIDRISSFEETLADLADRVASPESAATATAQIDQETIMDPKTKGQGGATTTADKPVTVESLRAEHGDLVATLEASAAEAALTEERARVAAIQAHAKPGRESLIAEMIGDGTKAADAATKILAAIDKGEIAAADAGKENPDAAKVLENIDKAAAGVVSSVSPNGESDSQAEANTPEGWKAAYEKDKAIRAEFPNADSYVAYKKREAAKAA